MVTAVANDGARFPDAVAVEIATGSAEFVVLAFICTVLAEFEVDAK